jgi:hypothetical protein
MSEQYGQRRPIRLTAAERQFERFVTATRRFGCDASAGRFEQTLAMLVAASPSRRPRFDPGMSDGEEARVSAHADLVCPPADE